MTEEMNQNQVAVAIFTPLRSRQQVVNLKVFVIEERFSTLSTPALLPFGKLLFTRRQVAGFGCLSLRPVVGVCSWLEQKVGIGM